jgi:hypothetical protein
MLTDIHEGKINIPVTLPVGSNIVVAGDPDRWVYVHEIIGDLSAAGSISVLSGADVLATFDLDDGQGITLDDVPGDDGVPRFKIKPGDDFIIDVTAGNFVGAVQYSFRY